MTYDIVFCPSHAADTVLVVGATLPTGQPDHVHDDGIAYTVTHVTVAGTMPTGTGVAIQTTAAAETEVTFSGAPAGFKVYRHKCDTDGEHYASKVNAVPTVCFENPAHLGISDVQTQDYFTRTQDESSVWWCVFQLNSGALLSAKEV